MNNDLPADIVICEDPAAVAQEAARRFVALAREAIAARGRFAVCLSGGSTPKAMYQILAEGEAAGQVDWAHVQVFWGDERCVPASDPESNYRMAKESLLDRVPLPAANIHRIAAETGVGAAAKYQAELIEALGPDLKLDLLLLGLGEDGHTASLFPGTPGLREEKRLVLRVEHATPPPPLVDRITLTFPILNAARCILFLVAGGAKAAILKEVLQGPRNPIRLPAQGIRPPDGRLLWLLDRTAASGLES